MSFSKIFGVLTLTVLVVGCGSPLNDSQKTAFKDMNKDLNTVVGKGSGRAAAAFGALAATPTERNAELEAKLADKLKTCNVQQPAPNEKNVTVKVDGANCGFKMEMQMNTNTNDAAAVDSTFKVFFEITDADLLALSDISKMDISGKFKIAESGVDIKVSGYLVSKKNGRVTMDMTGSGNAQSGGSFVVSYKSKNFDVNVEMKQSADGKVTMSINGKSATAKEINELFAGGGIIPGTSLKPDESESTGSLIQLN